MAFLEFHNDGLSNPTPVFCEGFLLIQPHLFIILFLPVGFGSTTPLTELSSPISCDQGSLVFVIYTQVMRNGREKGKG